MIVTRHTGLVEWLRRRGITGNVVHIATIEDVLGKTVYGNLPLYLASFAERVLAVEFDNLSPARRGSELSPEQMDEAGAVLRCYRVIEIESDKQELEKGEIR